MKTSINRFALVLVALLSGGLCALAFAAESQQAVVLEVHDEQATRAFIANHHLPAGQEEGGRFAVVELVDGPWGDASFALVYVPKPLSVADDDQVELVPGDVSVLTTLGRGVVTRVIHSDRVIR